MGKFTKNRKLIPALSALCVAMCVSVGFATWITTGGGTANASGNINADDVNISDEPVACITNLEFDGFKYYQGYGFVSNNQNSNGLYTNTTNFTGTFDFDVSGAKTCISSMASDTKLSLKIEFTTSATTNFTYGAPTISGFANTPVEVSTTSTATSYKAYNIILDNTEYSSSSLSNLSFSVSMTYTGSLSAFPSLSDATYSLTITPGEYVI